MKQLNQKLFDRYEIPNARPTCIRCIQFGESERLLGAADRLIDDANRNGADIGVAVVRLTNSGRVPALKEQDGLFTVSVRGEDVRRDQVVQSVLRAIDPNEEHETFLQLAQNGEVRLLLLEWEASEEYVQKKRATAELVARFCIERDMDGKSIPEILVIGDANAAMHELQKIAQSWGAVHFLQKLPSVKAYSSALDCIAMNATVKEAVLLCEKENYSDKLIHICEPYARWIVDGEETPLPCIVPQTHDAYERELALTTQVDDVALFCFFALGLMRGNDTLCDVLGDEPLRKAAGEALLHEGVPYLPFAQRDVQERLVTFYTRAENPMIETELSFACRGMLYRIRRSVLPLLKAHLKACDALPGFLTDAFAATILLYADVRRRETGYESVGPDGAVAIFDDPELLDEFTRLSSDMPADALAYAVLADRALWGEDLREIDGLQQRIENALNDTVTG